MPTSNFRLSFVLLLSEFRKLPLEMFLEQLGGVDQCFTGLIRGLAQKGATRSVPASQWTRCYSLA